MKRFIFVLLFAMISIDSYAFKVISQKFKHSPNTYAGIYTKSVVTSGDNPPKRHEFTTRIEENDIQPK